MRKPRSRAVVLMLLLAAAQAHAQQYRWVDEKGRVQYTDTPPPATAKDVQKKRLDVGKSDGPAQPSVHDLAMAFDAEALWLVMAASDADASTPRAFRPHGGAFVEVPLSIEEAVS